MIQGFSIRIKLDSAAAGLSANCRKYLQAMTGPEFQAMLGKAMTEEVQRNFDKLATERRSPWGTAPHFYETAADGTYWLAERSRAVRVIVSKPEGVRLRFYGSGGLPGGVVTAGKSISHATGKPTRMLAIPATQEAAGKPTRHFSGLKMLFGRGGRPWALAQMRLTMVPGKRKAQIKHWEVSKIFYHLAESSKHRHDYTVLPAVKTLTDAGRVAIRRWGEAKRAQLRAAAGTRK